MAVVPLRRGEFREETWAPYLNAQIQQATQDALGSAIDQMADGFAQAIEEGARQAGLQAREIARVIRDGIRPAQMAVIHQSVGEQAQAAVVRSYRAARNGQTRGASGYRQTGTFQRYSGGRLLAALSSPNFFTADAEGIQFINVGLLNDKAAQWARLNFGAGARGRGSRATFTVNFGGLVVASLGLNEGPRPAFWIPKGYFFRDGQVVQPTNPQSSPGAQFWVAGTGPRRGTKRVRGSDSEGQPYNALVQRKMTRGIEARNFLDAGLKVIAEQLPRRYLREVNEMYEQGLSTVRPAPVNIRVSTTSRFRRSSTSGLY